MSPTQCDIIAIEEAESIGLSPVRLKALDAHLARAVGEEQLPAVAVGIARRGVSVVPLCHGAVRPDPGSPPVTADSAFLVASVTKPVTAAAVMLLVERGLVTLDDPVAAVVPEFGRRGKEGVLIRHLLTHTSGLPDMLPDNIALRQGHAPLAGFVKRICDLELDFPPGTGIQYQSMGIAMLGEIVARVTGRALSEFIRREICAPLGMTDTSLGLGDLDPERVVHVAVGPDMAGTDWGWNSDYWRRFAAPWGGMFSTVGDMLRFCDAFLGGEGTCSVFSQATIEAMTRDQTSAMPGLSLEDRLRACWGLGWRIAGAPGWPAYLGDLVSPRAFGHSGATGTAVWADPQRDLACVVFTSQPQAASRGLLGRISNLVAASAL